MLSMSRSRFCVCRQLVDASELGTRGPATSKACTDVGVLRSVSLRSPISMPSPDILNLLQVFLLLPSLLGLLMVLLHLSFCVFCCSSSSVNPGHFFVHSVPRCSGFCCAPIFFRLFLLKSPLRDATFRPRFDFLILRSALVILFVPRCGTS